MRYGTISHPKFKSLQRMLGLPQYSVVGILESVWMLASQFTDDGDITRFTAQQICDYAGFEGDAESLIGKMIESKWLDSVDGRLRVHDFLDHAPAFIYERIKKRNQRRATQSSNVPSIVPVSPVTPRDTTGNSLNVPVISAQSSVVESSEVHEEENKGASLSVSSKAKAPKAPNPQWVMPEGVDKVHWQDWLTHRKAKKASNTPTAWAKVEREAAKAGLSISKVVQLCAEKSWSGFEAEWVSKDATDAKPSDMRTKTVYPRPPREAS
jgi:hypothetical protein